MRVLTAANASGGGIFILPSRGQAIRWRQRAYSLRKLLQKESARVYAGVEGRQHLVGSSPFDKYVLTLREFPESGTWGVVIKVEENPRGTLVLPDGTVLDSEAIEALGEGAPAPAQTPGEDLDLEL